MAGDTPSGGFPAPFLPRFHLSPSWASGIVPDAAHPHRTLGTTVAALSSLPPLSTLPPPLLGSNTEPRLLPESCWHCTLEAKRTGRNPQCLSAGICLAHTVRAAGRNLPAPCPLRPSPQYCSIRPLFLFSYSLLFLALPHCLPPFLLLFVRLGIVFILPFPHSTSLSFFLSPTHDCNLVASICTTAS